MKALKFYDKEGVGFELYMDYEKQSIMLQIEDSEAEQSLLELDDADIDDVIIALVELKNELVTLKNFSNN
jgi:hypothetical protein